MPRLRRHASRTLDALVVVLFLFFVGMLTQPRLWDGPLGIAWLALLVLLSLSFGVSIAIGTRRRR